MQLLNEKGAETSIEDGKWFAKEAFAVSSGYDSAIFNYFDDRQGSHFRAAVDDPMHCATVKTRTRLPSSMANSIICLTSCMVRKSLTTTCSTLTLLYKPD